MDNNLFSCGIFIDLQKAFDIVACVAGGIRGHKETGSLKYRLPKNYTI
jgi:hypothetical protein